MRVKIEPYPPETSPSCGTVGCKNGGPIWEVMIDHGPLGHSGFAFLTCAAHLEAVCDDLIHRADDVLFP